LYDDQDPVDYTLQSDEEQETKISIRQMSGSCTPLLSIRNREYPDLSLSTNRWATAINVEAVFPTAGFYIFKVERGDYDQDCEFELLVQTGE